MDRREGFLVLSPNLGCPRLVAQAHLAQGEPIALLIASDEWPEGCPEAKVFEDRFALRPVDWKGEDPAPLLKLRPSGSPRELTDWDCLGDFADAENTRWRLSRELHYGVLGAHTRYWRLELVVKSPEELAALMAGRRLLLFDLVWSSPYGAVANPHSVQVMAREDDEVRFLHVTDLHLARRNDEILAEVLKEKCGRSAKEIEDSYVNFNDHFRRMIRHANELADRGELDFLVITGDLVDFAFHGWRDRPCPAQNNWKMLVNMLTGRESRSGGNAV